MRYLRGLHRAMAQWIAPLGAPWLESEPALYIRAQLQAFASGDRHNDTSEQMRNVARQITPAEIDAAAQYYASQLP